MVKNLPAMQETQVRSLGQEDPLKKANENNVPDGARRCYFVKRGGGRSL